MLVTLKCNRCHKVYVSKKIEPENLKFAFTSNKAEMFQNLNLKLRYNSEDEVNELYIVFDMSSFR